MNVGAVLKTWQGVGTIAWCTLWLGTAGTMLMPCRATAADSTAATRTTLTVTTSQPHQHTQATLTAHVAAANEEATPTGVVTFRSETTDLGSAFLDREGNAALQTDNLTAGSHQIVAVYQGEKAFVTSTSDAEKLHANVAAVAGFTLAATPTSLSTPAGGFVNTIVTVTPNNGFNAYVSLSCKGLPFDTTCTFTPLSVPALCTTSVSGAETCAPGTSVMQIQTLAATPAASLRTGEHGMLRFAFILPALIGLAGLGAARNRGWRNLCLALLVLAGTLGMSSCAQRYRYLNHGPPPNTGTPLGSYIITIEAQSSTGSATTTPPTQPQLTLVVAAPKS